jgi:hypothetical protein
MDKRGVDVNMSYFLAILAAFIILGIALYVLYGWITDTNSLSDMLRLGI